MQNNNDIQRLKNYGFEGFMTIKELREIHQHSQLPVPAQGGVYASLRLSNNEPQFFTTGTGGAYQKKDPNMPIATLKRKWVDNTSIMYIGETSNLQDRISLYLNFGNGEPVRHWGGRYVWQLKDVNDMVVCWKIAPNEHSDIKKMMLNKFKEEHNGSKPFANIR